MTFPCRLTVRLGPKDWVLENRMLADAVRVLVQGTGELMCLFPLPSPFSWRPWRPCVPNGRETRCRRTIDPHQTWWNQEIKLLLLSCWDKDCFVTTEPSLFWFVQWKCLGYCHHSSDSGSILFKYNSRTCFWMMFTHPVCTFHQSYPTRALWPETSFYQTVYFFSKPPGAEFLI